MTEEMTQDEESQTKEIKDRIIRIKLIDGTKVNGRVNINRSDGFDRVSDLVNSEQNPFLTVMDATLYDKELENPARHKTLFINKIHILWATPEENQK